MGAQRKIRQHLRAFLLHGPKMLRIKTKGPDDRRGHLACFNLIGERRRREARVGNEQHHVAIVFGKTAVLGDLLAATRVGDADVGGNHDIGRARIHLGVIEDQIEGRTREDLPLSVVVFVRFEQGNGGRGLCLVREPDKRNVVFIGLADKSAARESRADAAKNRRRRFKSGVVMRNAKNTIRIDGRLAVLGRNDDERGIEEAAALEAVAR